jgi:hypothetical protein
MLLAGVDSDGTPQLWTTDPSGVFAAWKANAVGCVQRGRGGARAGAVSAGGVARSRGVRGAPPVPCPPDSLLSRRPARRNSRSLLELLEKSYKDGCSVDEAVRLAVKALLEVVESGAKSIEIAIMRRGAPMAMLAEADVAAVVAVLEAEKQAEAALAAGDEAGCSTPARWASPSASPSPGRAASWPAAATASRRIYRGACNSRRVACRRRAWICTPPSSTSCSPRA